MSDRLLEQARGIAASLEEENAALSSMLRGMARRAVQDRKARVRMGRAEADQYARAENLAGENALLRWLHAEALWQVRETSRQYHAARAALAAVREVRGKV